MSNSKDGGAAFPHDGLIIHYHDRSVRGDPAPGMSLRDWFAGQALAGFAANGSINIGSDGVGNELARASYAFADAMLTERTRTKP